MLSLHGQQALITGANTGIGRAVALSMARAGADIAINYIADRVSAEELAHSIEQMGRKSILLEADVRDEDAVQDMFGRAISYFSTLHIVVCNAGIQHTSAITTMTSEQWFSSLNTNLTGQFLCIREASREFLRRGVQSVSQAAGKIICITSVHQKMPWPLHSGYAASKGGAMMLMKSVAQELAPKRIRVNGIAPGAIKTPINTSAWATPEARYKLEDAIPYGRIGDPDDIAAAATWLSSDASDYVVGAVLFVDGGLSLASDNSFSD